MKKLLTPYTTLPALCLLLLSCLASCSDDNFEEYEITGEVSVHVDRATGITSNSATLNGYIIRELGVEPIDECYFLYWQRYAQDAADTFRIDLPVPPDGEKEIFCTARIAGLTTDSIYRYTLCARYGDILLTGRSYYYGGFRVDAKPLVFSDLQYTDLTPTSVTLSGSVLDDGDGQLKALELRWRDFYYESENEVELSPDSYSFTYTVSGLVPNTTYYFWMRGSNQYPYDSDYLVLKTPSAS